VLRLAKQDGSVLTSSVVSGEVLVEQLVSINEERMTIPALTANKVGNGKVVHLNFAMHEYMGIASTLMERAILWVTELMIEQQK
jgi:hypothetical protein